MSMHSEAETPPESARRGAAKESSWNFLACCTSRFQDENPEKPSFRRRVAEVCYFVNNRELNAQTDGIALRTALELSETSVSDGLFAPWGSRVWGVVVEKDKNWIDVRGIDSPECTMRLTGHRYLPITIRGCKVLFAAPQPTARQKAQHPRAAMEAAHVPVLESPCESSSSQSHPQDHQGRASETRSSAEFVASEDAPSTSVGGCGDGNAVLGAEDSTPSLVGHEQRASYRPVSTSQDQQAVHVIEPAAPARHSHKASLNSAEYRSVRIAEDQPAIHIISDVDFSVASEQPASPSSSMESTPLARRERALERIQRAKHQAAVVREQAAAEQLIAQGEELLRIRSATEDNIANEVLAKHVHNRRNSKRTSVKTSKLAAWELASFRKKGRARRARARTSLTLRRSKGSVYQDPTKMLAAAIELANDASAEGSPQASTSRVRLTNFSNRGTKGDADTHDQAVEASLQSSASPTSPASPKRLGRAGFETHF